MFTRLCNFLVFVITIVLALPLYLYYTFFSFVVINIVSFMCSGFIEDPQVPTIPLNTCIGLRALPITSTSTLRAGTMAPPTSYLAVLKAAYDYTPDSEDEIAIKEDQILFLIERTDDEYVPSRAISTIRDLQYL